MARGSNLEAQTQMVISRGLGIGDVEKIGIAEGLSFEVGKMLTVMMRRIG